MSVRAYSFPAVHRLRLPCRQCSRYRAVEEFVGGPVVGTCQDCYSANAVAIAELRGITGCCGCNTTFAAMREREGAARLRLVPKDGVWQLICDRCFDYYATMRRDLYGHTPFGRKRNL
jgi:hypothetical protein